MIKKILSFLLTLSILGNQTYTDNPKKIPVKATILGKADEHRAVSGTPPHKKNDSPVNSESIPNTPPATKANQTSSNSSSTTSTLSSLPGLTLSLPSTPAQAQASKKPDKKTTGASKTPVTKTTTTSKPTQNTTAKEPSSPSSSPEKPSTTKKNGATSKTTTPQPLQFTGVFNNASSTPLYITNSVDTAQITLAPQKTTSIKNQFYTSSGNPITLTCQSDDQPIQVIADISDQSAPILEIDYASSTPNTIQVKNFDSDGNQININPATLPIKNSAATLYLSLDSATPANILISTTPPAPAKTDKKTTGASKTPVTKTTSTSKPAQNPTAKEPSSPSSSSTNPAGNKSNTPNNSTAQASTPSTTSTSMPMEFVGNFHNNTGADLYITNDSNLLIITKNSQRVKNLSSGPFAASGNPIQVSCGNQEEYSTIQITTNTSPNNPLTQINCLNTEDNPNSIQIMNYDSNGNPLSANPSIISGIQGTIDLYISLDKANPANLIISSNSKPSTASKAPATESRTNSNKKTTNPTKVANNHSQNTSTQAQADAKAQAQAQAQAKAAADAQAAAQAQAQAQAQADAKAQAQAQAQAKAAADAQAAAQAKAQAQAQAKAAAQTQAQAAAGNSTNKKSTPKLTQPSFTPSVALMQSIQSATSSKADIFNSTSSPIYFGGVNQNNSLWMIAPNSGFTVGIPNTFLIYPASSTIDKSTSGLGVVPKNDAFVINLTYNSPSGQNSAQTATVSGSGSPTVIGSAQTYSGVATIITDSTQPTGLSLVNTSEIQPTQQAIAMSQPQPPAIVAQLSQSNMNEVPLSTFLYNDTGNSVYVSDDTGAQRATLNATNGNVHGIMNAKSIYIFKNPSYSGACLQLSSSTNGIINIVEYDANNKPKSPAYTVTYNYGPTYSPGYTQAPNLHISNNTSVSGLLISIINSGL